MDSAASTSATAAPVVSRPELGHDGVQRAGQHVEFPVRWSVRVDPAGEVLAGDDVHGFRVPGGVRLLGGYHLGTALENHQGGVVRRCEQASYVVAGDRA